MQIQQFSTGSYVAHKMTVAGSPCRFSVWLNADGVLTDAERIDRAGRSYPVGAGQRRALQRSLAVYRPPYS